MFLSLRHERRGFSMAVTFDCASEQRVEAGFEAQERFAARATGTCRTPSATEFCSIVRARGFGYCAGFGSGGRE
jgi:hypothetical protein